MKNWVSEVSPEKGNLKQTPEPQKSMNWKKSKDAELEHDILKKAIGIFQERSMKYVFIKNHE